MNQFNNDGVRAYYQRFLASLPPDSPYRGRDFVVEPWGDTPELADELGALIADGTKTAACCSYWEWELEGKINPKVGLITIVINSKSEPLCIIETDSLVIQPFNEVDAAHAFAEGEGDRSWQYWYDEHWKVFSRTLPSIGRETAENMPVVCEYFHLIYKEN
ncbi:MAG: ASCH domain-containing protein [Anaerolineaceae bacterium]|nr:ASCH domain-containing protein [Anaerolineaceae bacterium]